MAAGPADKAIDLFKDLVFDPLVKYAIGYIVGLAPFLAFGPISFIIGQVVTYVAGIIYEQLKDTINLEVILLNNAAHHAAFVSAEIELKKIALTKGIDSPEFYDSREKHKIALAVFARHVGS